MRSTDPAFPVPPMANLHGLSKRELFAAVAMHALLIVHAPLLTAERRQMIAEEAQAMADAQLDQLAGRPHTFAVHNGDSC